VSGLATVNLTGSGILNQDVTVAIGSTDGAAVSPDDYTLSTTLVTFLAGTDLSTNPTQDVTFTLFNDRLVEGAEDFTLSLGAITSPGDDITPGTTTDNIVTIGDNDTATVTLS